MLCQFSFHNFRSYKSETTFDFQAATLPEFKDTLITQDKASDLLPVAVVTDQTVEVSLTFWKHLPA